MGSANKVKFGLEQVHVAFSDGTGGWNAPTPIPGAVNLSINPDGGESAFYADNKKYYVRYSNNGYTGTLEMALIPTEVLVEMLGWEIDDNGMMVEITNGQPKEFALLGQVLGDVRNRRFVYYRCKASRPAENAATTTENVTPTTETLNLTILPIELEGKQAVKGVIEPDVTNLPIYNAFFEQVTLPNAVPLVVDKTALENAIDLAGTLDEADYTVNSWTAFSAALTAAQTVFEDADATQTQVNQATEALKAAILNLIPAGE
jgi:phi13 family phage major tail protein